jgi:8-oxo-dGTP pyrophosphatase MutT (NUDIX family)
MIEGMRRDRHLFMIGAGAVVVDPDDRVLMLEQERDGAIEWEGPGGAVDGNESPAGCAIRETAEECGLAVTIDRVLRVSEYWERGAFVGVGFLFLAHPEGWPQEVRLQAQDGPTRFLSYRWCTRAEVAALEPRWAYEITRYAWPPEIGAPIFDRLDFPPSRP